MPTYLIECGDYQDLALIEIGDQKCAPLYSFGPFVRNEYIFHYIISGKGYVALNKGSDTEVGRINNIRTIKAEYPIKAGEGFLIEPHTKHIYFADEEEPWHYVWVVFKGLSAPSYLHQCGLSRTNYIYRPIDYNVKTSQKIRCHLMSILENPNADPAFIIGHFSLFFSELIKNSARDQVLFQNFPQKASRSNHYMTQALAYIHGNHCKIRSIDEIADFCHISRSHLGRLFRETLHISPQEYLIQYRLNRAKYLLSSTTMPICDIASDVGYQNELNLLRAFKKAFGVSPSVWRSENTV